MTPTPAPLPALPEPDYLAFYAGKIERPMTLDQLRAEVRRLSEAGAPSPELLLAHAMLLLDAAAHAQQPLTDAAQAAMAEVEKATRKFPTWPTDPLHALAVLGEEFGELTKDVLQMVYEPHKTNRDRIRTECVQTAAMALRFLASLDRYEYRPGEQHSQAGIPAPTTDTGEQR